MFGGFFKAPQPKVVTESLVGYQIKDGDEYVPQAGTFFKVTTYQNYTQEYIAEITILDPYNQDDLKHLRKVYNSSGVLESMSLHMAAVWQLTIREGPIWEDVKQETIHREGVPVFESTYLVDNPTARETRRKGGLRWQV